MRRIAKSMAAGFVLALTASPALAQKSKDTLLISTIEFLGSADYYHDPSSESAQFIRNIYGYPTFGQPTVTNLMNFFFTGNRDYNQDPEIKKGRLAGAKEFDLVKRTAIYRKVLNRVNSEAYIYPLTEFPTIWAHGDKVQPRKNPYTIAAFNIGDWFWK